MTSLISKQIHITGIVQGVGFRPFIYEIAVRNNLKGWVRNTSAGVDIQVEGNPESIGCFLKAIPNETPPLASIDEISINNIEPDGFSDFKIIPSQPIHDAFQPVSPDMGICPDCLKELFTLTDRRYHYPFINCTNCGPRFTIIQDIPYDRPLTTMKSFQMCEDCSREYNDPRDRRFHAQPIACPKCGPNVWLEFSTSSGNNNLENYMGFDAITQAITLLKEGYIIAIKGLGGFHIACDALNEKSVTELRNRKMRIEKPFAVMMDSIDTLKKHCHFNQLDQELILSQNSPIVIVERRSESTISEEVSPNQHTLGVMLPYTPLHHLLFWRNPTVKGIFSQLEALVMTSANFSEEPIVFENEFAREHLNHVVDAFLMHDRQIETRCDDSVYRSFYLPTDNSTHIIQEKYGQQDLENSPYPIRRSRGYAPHPLYLPWNCPSILAVGAELKNTICVTKNKYAFVSHHIGDLENYDTLLSFEKSIQHYEKLFRVSPEVIAYDLHPDYLSTQYALCRSEEDGLQKIGVQHHHAHIASCMAENKIDENHPVIGVSFDGSGFGTDGHIWGGEFLVATYSGFERMAHLKYVPLPGGESAIRNPAKTAVSYLWQENLGFERDLPSFSFFAENELKTIYKQLENNINCPLTSSIGRLFDAVSSIIGIRNTINYEGQAAIELEASLDKSVTDSYHYQIEENRGVLIIDPGRMINSVVEDVRSGISQSIIAARFHNSLAEVVGNVCRIIRDKTGYSIVALSGGVWQNMTLLSRTIRVLNKQNFKVIIHHKIPTNDGGISFGQAIIISKLII